jgi:hypothetical protein
VADKGAGEADEQAHVGGRFLAVLVFGIAVGKVDADTDDLLGIRHRDLVGETAMRMGDGAA